VAFRKDRIKELGSESLRSVLAPGEQEVVYLSVIAGPNPWLALGLLGLIGQLFTQYYYVAATDRRVVFLGQSRWSTKFKGLAFADPRTRGVVSDVKVGSVWSSFRYRRPDGKVLRLNVHRIWRSEMGPFLQALGASV